MEWFNTWWNSLGLIGQIMACSAIPMTVVMLLQFILLIIGVGFGSETDGDAEIDSNVDADIDADGDTDFAESITDVHDSFDTENDAGIGEISSYADKSAKETDGRSSSSILKIFTIRGIVAFFALGGWAGLAALSAGVPAIWAIQIALFVGVSAMLLASFMIRLALRMQESGNLNLNNTIAQVAEVYINIPPARTDRGKITMLLQERFVELDAVTDSDVELKPHTKVEVIAIADKDCLLVSPAAEKAE